jgi:S-adenosylmethionine synthetase
MQLFIEKIKDPVEKRDVEFVEVKGIGHPDTICDSVCEACADALARFYKQRFGSVMHYNIDKALLVAGASAVRFGDGKIVSPVKLTIAGRVTDKVGDKTIDARAIIKKAAEQYLSRFKSRFDINVDVKSAAANLAVVSKKKKPVANDTSFGASHHPYSKTEKLVLDVSKYINSPDFIKRFPAVGLDTKVMGIRMKDRIELTVAIAFVARYVKDMAAYINIKNKIMDDIIKRYHVNVQLNTLDDVRGDENSIYLTVSGLSAEMGDDGQVGRGNRHNGMITPSRPMSLEATCGKNSRHPGRSYQVAAHKIAKELVRTAKVRSAEVQLVTNIGAPLEEPKAVSLKIYGNVSKSIAEKIVRRCIKEAINS